MDGDLARRPDQARRGLRLRQSALALLFPLLLGACGGLSDIQPTIVPSQPYLGSVAAGEPNAALAARDILKAGGSAADAAAALAMTLAVTRPSRASLWAGGVCLVNDSKDGEQWVYSFIHPASGEGEAPPPMLVRGLALMHTAHGRLRWGAVPAAAERLALLGHPVSRAFARDIETAPGNAATVFAGRPPGEGDLLAQPELARILRGIRLDGPGALYSGPLAAALMQGAAAAGYRLDEAILGRGLPSGQEPLSAEGEPWRAYFVADEASAGPGQAAFWLRLVEDDRIDDSAPPVLPLAAEGETEEAPEAGGGTGFAVVDAEGLAVACGFTMNAPFGTGRVAAGTGIAIAAPRPAGAADPALSPFLVTLEAGDEIRFAGAASGMGAGRVGPAVALRTLLEADTLEAAIARPRAVRGSGKEIAVEAAIPEAARAGLQEDGFTLSEVERIGFVAAVRCQARAPGDVGAVCRAHADPRGAGLAVQVFGE